SIQGTVRTLSSEARALYERRIGEIAAATAIAYGCRASCEYRHGYPITANDPRAVATFERVARDSIGAAQVRRVTHPVMIGEDFAYYGLEVPSCFFALGLRPTGHESMPDLHQPDFDFTDAAIPIGVELFCRLALRER